MHLKRHFHLPPLEGVLRAVNFQYGGDYDPTRTDVVQVVYRADTRLDLTFHEHRSQGPQQLRPGGEDRTFTVDRFSLNTEYPEDVEVRLDHLTFPITTNDLAEVLTVVTGVSFAPDDFAPAQWAIPTASGRYPLTANPESFRWLGGMTVSVVPLKRPVDDVLTHTDLTHTLASVSDGLSPGMFQLMGLDFTDDRDVLKALRVDRSAVPNRDLLEVINSRSVYSWGVDFTYSSWNLAHELIDPNGPSQVTYNVLYNGRAVSEWTPRLDCRYVTALGLSPDYCANVSGYILLHYN